MVGGGWQLRHLHQKEMFRTSFAAFCRVALCATLSATVVMGFARFVSSNLTSLYPNNKTGGIKQ